MKKQHRHSLTGFNELRKVYKNKTLAERALEFAIDWIEHTNRRFECEDFKDCATLCKDGCSTTKCKWRIKKYFMDLARRKIKC
jgi:hypothetical protein